MSMRYEDQFVPGQTPQREKADPRQVENSAGGFSFQVDDWKRLERFLILGSEGGTYYIRQEQLTRENAKVVMSCIEKDPKRVIKTVVEISQAGRAPKNDPALFVLALVSKHAEFAADRKAAFEVLPKVARIGTHFLHFARMVEAVGGWGRITVRGMSDWYLGKTADQAAFQMLKYQSRDGWSHVDVLRKCHLYGAKDLSQPQKALFRFVVDRENLDHERDVKKREKPYEAISAVHLPEIALAYAKANEPGVSLSDLCKIITEHKLPREMIPTDKLGERRVWEAMLPNLGMDAVLRNLGKLSKLGMVQKMSPVEKFIREKFADVDALRASRLHPLKILIGMKTYSQGRGDKGSLTWDVNQRVVDALNDAFHTAFKTVEPTGKRTLLALDVSGSMSMDGIAGTSLTPREGAAAMALVTAAIEPSYAILGFGHELVPVPISPHMRLDQVVQAVSDIPMGGTDCALPMLWALKSKSEVDTFVVYTDSETWFGNIHPYEALKQYRDKMGIAAKLIVVGMTSNGFTIADPDDAGMLDVVGFDSAAPSVIADFSRE